MEGNTMKYEAGDVTYNDEKEFATEAEAKAFVEGIEYVNDSALTVVGIETRTNRGSKSRFVVCIQDADKE
jgi:hypothetical protein